MEKKGKRCCWAEETSEIYVRYHDEEWGVPVYDDEKLLEMLLLESFQAGLSWITVLKKREAFRAALDGFDRETIAAYGDSKVEELMQNAGIIRNRRKITATIQNARVFGEIQQEFGTFSDYLWGFTEGKVIREHYEMMPASTELSDRVSKDLKGRGMNFVGTVIIYSYLQAVGVVDDHEVGCICWKGDQGEPETSLR